MTMAGRIPVGFAPDFEAPADGDYVVHLKDVRGLEGKNFAYRLSIQEADADFQLGADVMNPNIPRGGSELVTVVANRVRGYEGPIDIQAEGLPPVSRRAPRRFPQVRI